jgi:putative membrane protein
MGNYYWSDWYSGWGWFLWFGIMFLFIASVGNWGYTYKAHRRFDTEFSGRNPLDILNERYARGELNHEEYARMKANLTPQLGSQSDELTKRRA